MRAVTCTKHVPLAQRQDGISNASLEPIFTAPPPRPKIRAEVEPPTSNMTLYGVTRPPGNPPARAPATYESKDWVSVSKSDFPQQSNRDRLSKELQIARANVMRSHDVAIGDPGCPPQRVTQHISYRPYEREFYLARTVYPIGGEFGGRCKVQSDVDVSGDTCEPQHYEPMTQRQFQVHPINANDNRKGKEARFENKSDMTRSHFSIGSDSVEYRPVSKDPLETMAPLVKNRPPSAVAPAKNPYFVANAADARPVRMTPQEIAADKSISHVPLTNPSVESLTSTTTKDALPSFVARRRDMVRTTKTTISSLCFGVDKTPYVPSTAAQYRGIYYKAGTPS